jgi:flavorubredoxin
MAIPQNTNVNETFAELTKTDDKVTSLANSHYSKPASAERINAAKAGLEKNGFKVTVVNTRADAFEALKNLIPAVSCCFFLSPNFCAMLSFRLLFGDVISSRRKKRRW